VSDPLNTIAVDHVIVVGDITSGDSSWEAGIFGAYWVSEAEVESSLIIDDVYWDTDLSGVYNSGVDGIDIGGEGKTTFDLQCPTAPGDVSCDPTLFTDWDETIWNFGTSSDYPKLIGDKDDDGYRDDEDVDDNNNGLIEISTLQELDLMRYDLAGTSLNGNSAGCPATDCNGYELVNDLDFDTNGNGVADAGDLFWNGGNGWTPAGWITNTAFTGIFEGNGHVISNLNIQNFSHDKVGLISVTNGAYVKNITFNNPAITLSTGNKKYAGVLAGKMDNSSVHNVNVENVILTGYSYSGAITGSYKSDLPVTGIHASGRLEGTSRVAGLFGTLRGLAGPNSLSASDISFIGEVYAESSSSGLAGSVINTNLNNCYVTGTIESSGHNTAGVTSRILDSTVSRCHINAVVKVRDDNPYGASSYFTGGFFAEMGSSILEESSFVGGISSVDRYAGGVAGGVTGTVSITDVSIHADISADTCCTGGIFGAIYSKVSDPLNTIAVDHVIVVGDITSGDSSWEAGIFGAYWVSETELESSLIIDDVYWDTDLSGVYNSGVDGIDIGGEGKTTFDLQCPTEAGDVTCNASIYADWDEVIWDFGTSSDYPVLR
jgi:hypothetical protein